MKKTGIALIMVLSLVLSACSSGKADSNPDLSNNTASQEKKEVQGISRDAVKMAAPDFELETLKGSKVKLSDLKGKTVVINFFATWCPPCRAELPGFVSTMEEYQEEKPDVVFLFVDVDEEDETVKEFLDDRNYTFDILMDYGANVYSKYTLRGGIPTTTIVDSEGNISAQHEGLMESVDLKYYIEEALGKQN